MKLEKAERILPSLNVLPVPSAPEIICGAINREGSVVPVVNFRKRMLTAEKTMKLNDKLMIAFAGRFQVAIPADDVEGVVEYENSLILESFNFCYNITRL